MGFADEEIGIQIIKLPSPVPVEGAIRILRDSGDYDFVEPDYIGEQLAIPNDPLFTQQWALRSTLYPNSDVQADAAWDLQPNANGVIVAVLDSGTETTHPDLAGNHWVNPYEIPGNLIDDDQNGYIDDINGWNFVENNATLSPTGANDHGVHVAGIIGASKDQTPATGIAGLASGCRLMTLKFIGDVSDPNNLQPGSLSDFIKCLAYARKNGAKIINVSWGFTPNSSESVRLAIGAARNAGCILICAAGNTGFNIDDNQPYGFGHRMFPAGYYLDNVISVTSLRHDGSPSGANYGTVLVHMAAPGGAGSGPSNEILSTGIPGPNAYVYKKVLPWRLLTSRRHSPF